MSDRLLPLSRRMRLAVLALSVLLILFVVNIQILHKEAIVDEGHTLLLRLAPQDPRSLMQGDYMALRYAIAGEVADIATKAALTDGLVVVARAPNGEASLVGLYQGEALSADQFLLRFRRRGESVRLASDAYFFEEGQWRTFADARFGELRVDSDGDAVLVGLRDAAGGRLGAALH